MGLNTVAVPATFWEFIVNQTLLNTSASVTTLESGERVDAPTAVLTAGRHP